MKDIFVVLKEKETELERLKTEQEKIKTQIIALRYVAPILFEEGVDDLAKRPTPTPPPSGVTAATMASAAGAGTTAPTAAPGTATKPAVRGWP